MSACVIAFVDVTDPVQYETYKPLASAAIAEHGARIVVRGGAVSVLEGDVAPGRVVVLEFPSSAAARAFYDSPTYRAAREARAGAARMTMLLVEGPA